MPHSNEHLQVLHIEQIRNEPAFTAQIDSCRSPTQHNDIFIDEGSLKTSLACQQLSNATITMDNHQTRILIIVQFSQWSDTAW